jgi:hypothetical protein
MRFLLPLTLSALVSRSGGAPADADPLDGLARYFWTWRAVTQPSSIAFGSAAPGVAA